MLSDVMGLETKNIDAIKLPKDGRSDTTTRSSLERKISGLDPKKAKLAQLVDLDIHLATNSILR